MHGFRRTLFFSHLGLVALTVLLLLGTFRGMAPRLFEEQLRARLISHAAWARRAVTPKITDDGFDVYLTRQDLKDLQRELREYARENNIRLVIVSRDLRVLSDSGFPRDNKNDVPEAETALNERPEVAAALQGETNWTPLGSWRDTSSSMTLATPIRQGDEVIGCVLASSTVLLLTPAVITLARSFFLFLAVILVLVAILSIGLAQRLALPVRRLEEATRRLAAGDLTSRVQMHKRFLGRGDELDRLTREFNSMAAKIERVDRERRAFLADVSHELRTPLTAIKGSAETLRDGAWQNPQFAPRFADTIVAQSNRLIRLVGDLLNLARLEAASESQSKSQMSTQLSSCDLCERATAATRGLFDERGVVLHTDCTDFALCGDPDLLEQLLINLLANAARHSDSNTTTTLRICQEAGHAVLQVRDEGCGIAKEHLPHLGERFYRVEEGRERTQNGRESGGSGLGLAICRRIALAHGGHLQISSEVGQGTVVTVTLPH